MTSKNLLSKWFHKEPLISAEPFCFTKDYLKRKKVLQIIKKVRKRCFFKEPLTEWLFVEPNMVLVWHHGEEPFEAPLFLRVYLMFT